MLRKHDGPAQRCSFLGGGVEPRGLIPASLKCGGAQPWLMVWISVFLLSLRSSLGSLTPMSQIQIQDGKDQCDQLGIIHLCV